jgi:hypothetical protein
MPNVIIPRTTFITRSRLPRVRPERGLLRLVRRAERHRRFAERLAARWRPTGVGLGRRGSDPVHLRRGRGRAVFLRAVSSLRLVVEHCWRTLVPAARPAAMVRAAVAAATGSDRHRAVRRLAPPRDRRHEGGTPAADAPRRRFEDRGALRVDTTWMLRIVHPRVGADRERHAEPAIAVRPARPPAVTDIGLALPIRVVRTYMRREETPRGIGVKVVHGRDAAVATAIGGGAAPRPRMERSGGSVPTDVAFGPHVRPPTSVASIADEVIRQLDRRFLAHRERFGSL